MRVASFSTKSYDRQFLEAANSRYGHELMFYEARLCHETAALAREFPAVCVFVHDVLDAKVLKDLSRHETRVVALRCAGFNNVNVAAAKRLGVMVVRVPTYSPDAVAEHAVMLMLALNRRVHRAYARVREGNFNLEGLLGFDLRGLTVGVVGTGRIGAVVVRIMMGFGCKVLAYDPVRNPEVEASGGKYVSLTELFEKSDIVSLHCPLMPQTCHIVDAEALARMKDGVMLINTSRGALIDTEAVIEALKSGKVGYLGLDVYEEEADLFYEDLSSQVIQDDVFARLLTMPNVIVTGHQAFFTRNALETISDTTLANISDVEEGRKCPNEVTPDLLAASTDGTSPSVCAPDQAR